MRIEKWMNRVIMENYAEYDYVYVMFYWGEFNRVKTLDKFLDLR